jgi:2-dehydro-3-deoxyphosphooctonate aldolase (KDO 8-P synthase)
VLIAGPCVIESEDATLDAAMRLKQITARLGMPHFLPSFDKAAVRQNPTGGRGSGKAWHPSCVGRELDLPLLSDVHRFEEIGPAAEVLTSADPRFFMQADRFRNGGRKDRQSSKY